jgi:L-ascorbate metabolism protein UlaG (beta-lactamase superfamily)
MDVQFYGANCIVITSRQTRLVVDDNLDELGAKSISKEGDIALFTSPKHTAPAHTTKLMVDQPGEYEVANVSIYGIAARAHIDAEGKNATVYKIVADDIEILIVGHIYPELSDAQLEAIGMVDVMFVPVGGNGFTLDGIGALKIIKKVEPKLVIPTYYEDSKLQLPVPAQPLEQALKALAMEPKDTIIGKLRLKEAELPATTQLTVLERA